MTPTPSASTIPTPHMLLDIWPGSTDSIPDYITLAGNGVFFNAESDIYSYELFITDGTINDTRLTRDVRPGYADSSPNDIAAFLVMMLYTLQRQQV